AERPILLRQVRWAIRAASRYAPWRCLCLEQAMTAKALLHRKGLQSTLYLGLTRDDAGALQAHAWLRCGSVVLTGGRDMARYTVVSTFAEK
ncbi:MAG: lasso peptide biosynthesis B2 protein, partial [Desulfatitalea sp.]|nr:lasso peptide biosynthesis B2 protein [Desulfatitalea sp.]NNJ99282.1 lasso peptide biosynthesis B2 protein [Desulfatitalea sp.]